MNDKHVRYARHVPKTLAALIARTTKPAIKKRGFAEARILTDWPQIVGAELAAHALPQKLSTGRDGATLHILAESGWAVELQYMEPVILDKLATFFGKRAVSRLVIHHGPLPTPVPKRGLKPAAEPLPDDVLFAQVSDEPLKGALRRLGGAIHKQRNTCNRAKDCQYEDV